MRLEDSARLSIRTQTFMSAATDFISWFRQSAPYIHAHRGRCFVVLIGGERLDAADFPALMHDLALLHALGVRVVLVYGARPQIEALIAEQGGASRYADGLRITDAIGLEAAKEAAGRLRVEIEALLSMGVAGSPMGGARLRVASGNFITARPLGVLNGQDFEHTGEVRRVDAAGIRARLDADDLILVSPLGYSPTGEIFNLSAEDVAVAIATALQADKLILSADLGAAAMPETLAAQGNGADFLTPGEAERWLEQGRLTPDTATAVAAALHACRNGVRRAHLVDVAADGALLRELFTRDGVGLLITSDQYEDIRPARIDDIAGIRELLIPLEEAGILVPRTPEHIELAISDFMVIDRDGLIVGCAALHPLGDAEPGEPNWGELACLALRPEYRNSGRGDALLQYVERRAGALNLTQLVVLTTRTAHWFRERGFVPGHLEELPAHRQSVINYRRNAKVFMKRLTA